MRRASFDVEHMTDWQLLVTLQERLGSLRADGIGFEHPRTLQRRVRVCEALLAELVRRERQLRLFS